MSIRWKIALLCIALAVLPLYYFQRYTTQRFDLFTRTMLEKQMIDYAHVIGDDFRRQQMNDQLTGDDFDTRLKDYQSRFQAQLLIVSTNGTILHHSAEEPPVGQNIANERDIQRAMEGRYGARMHMLPDRSLLYYHIALPVRDEHNELIAIASVRAHTRDITRAIDKMAKDYRFAMILVALIAILASIILSTTLTLRLRALTLAMQSFARGESRFSFRSHGRDEIARLGKAFEQMSAEIENIRQRQGQLLDATVHQLKTPLTAIKGAVEILQADDLDPVTQNQFLRNIDISADRLLTMIRRMGELARLKTEELRGSKEPIAYHAFLRELVQRLFPSPSPPIELILPENEIMLTIHAERMEQVLVNLLDNAIRHTPPDGRITITTKIAQQTVETIMEDTGSGIEPSDLDCVFEQFFSTVPREHAKESGMGIGLSIARSIIENHGGTITAESKGTNQGSRFTFTLPIQHRSAFRR